MTTKSNAKTIVGVSGKIGSGKTTVVRYLVKKYHFQQLSYRILLEDLFRASSSVDGDIYRKDLQDFGVALTNVVGHAGLTAMLIRAVRRNKVALDGIRHYNGYRFLVGKYGTNFHLIYRDISTDLRYALNNRRSYLSNIISFEEFQKIDSHPSESGIDVLNAYSRFKLPYFEDIDQLYQAIDSIIYELAN